MRKAAGKRIKATALGLAVCLAWMSAVGAGTPAPAADTAATAEDAAQASTDSRAAAPATEAPAEAASAAGSSAPAEDAAQAATDSRAAAPATEAPAEAASAAEASTADAPAVETAIPYWEDDSAAMASIIEYVVSVTDEHSPDYKKPEARIAVFDVDGTLFGELFPTYVDQCMMMYRILHDDTYEEPDPEDKAYTEALEKAMLSGEPEPDYDKSSGQIIAEAFKGLTIDEYRQYVRAFMAEPAIGFEGMCYGDGFYKPMTALVQYLAAHDFQVYICSGAERTFLRELTEGTLDEWIPPQQVMGTTFSLTATGQGDEAGRSYTYTADDEVLLEGNMTFKNQKMNKVASNVQEIGVTPILAFGNSSGDFAMGQYTVQHGGKAYMLLCDDTERDYGNTEKAAKFAQQCAELGFETVSMKNEFTTIYGENVRKTEISVEEPAKEPAEKPAKEPAKKPAEDPAKEDAEKENAEDPATENTEKENAEKPAKESEEKPASGTGENPAKAPEEEETLKPAA